MSEIPTSTALAPWGSDTNNEERMFALIAHLLTFLLPVLGPGIIYLIKKDTSRYVSYHALQALVFQLVAWILNGTVVGCLLGIPMMLYSIYQGIRAYNGEWAGYPLIETVGK